MTADALLDLQALDVETRQLNHRREALEQRTKLDEALSEQARRQVEIDTIAAARLEVSSRQKKAEADAQLVSDKADADESKLYGGEVTGLKDLEALQHEIAMLPEQLRGPRPRGDDGSRGTPGTGGVAGGRTRLGRRCDRPPPGGNR